MATAGVKVDYLSAGANRYANVADWNVDGKLAFGADNNVCIWRPTVGFPFETAKELNLEMTQSANDG